MDKSILKIELLALLRNEGLRVTRQDAAKDADSMTCTWRVHGSHERVARLMLNDPDVTEFHAS